jgi:hypothetical protein
VAILPFPRTRRHLPLAVALLPSLLLGGCGGDNGDTDRSGAAPRGGPGEPTPEALAAAQDLGTKLAWDDLIPAGWHPSKPFEGADVDDISDDDPRADTLFSELREQWAKAPVVKALDGRSVRLSGLVIPLTADATELREFLLVPYFGACIHVPPPPANQTVHVVTRAGRPYHGELFDTVWVKGTMHVARFRNDRGDAGYRIDAVSVSHDPQDG